MPIAMENPEIPPNPTSEEGDEENELQEITPIHNESRKKMWRLPWWTALFLFFFFAIFWSYAVVIQRYWVREDWTAALPGLGTTPLRKLSMRSHLTLGAIAMMCSPIQLLVPLKSGWKNPTSIYRYLHRWVGRTYAICAVFSYVFGQWFILLKKFRLVGGYNMGIAFSLSGFVIAYFAYKTWETAPSRSSVSLLSESRRIQEHKQYAIRSVSQIIAPLLYRYFYFILMFFNIYRTPNMADKLVCNKADICTDYERRFDALYCWLYWLVPWGCAEVIILCLLQDHPVTEEPAGGEARTPLLNSIRPGNTDTNYGKRRVRILNFLGCLLAGITVLGTGPLLLDILFSNG